MNKSLPTLDDRNFASFARNVSGLKTRKIVILRGATLPPEISATFGSPKFLNLQNFFKFFFRKSRFFEISTFDFFNEGGAPGPKFFFEVMDID